MLTLQQNLPAVPVLETQRLRLRGHRPSDFDAVHAMWADPAIVAMITGTPSTAAETETRLLRHIGHWAAYGWGYWAVEKKVSGLYVGDVGFSQFRRAVTPSIENMPEIGWVLAGAHHGKGYATEAATAALAWMDVAMPGTRTCCIFHPDHAASMRIAEKLGFSLWTQGVFRGQPTPIYTRG